MRGIVPAYEYDCQECGERFEVRMSIAAYSEGPKVACGFCGSTKVTRAFTAVNVLTGSRTGGAPAPSGGGCGHSGFS